MLNGPILVFHPLLGGFLTFRTYEEASAAADDLGEEWDYNALGYLKSRVTMCHLA